MKKKKQYAVFGLGKFGKNVAITLEECGVEVIGVDINDAQVDAIADKLTCAYCMDVTNQEALSTIGLDECDGAIVAFSDNLEASIIAVMICKDYHVPMIMVKVANEFHGRIMEKLGVDRVILPEHEMGIRIARTLAKKDYTAWFELSGEYSMVEVNIPKNWRGKTLAQLDLRKKLDVNVIGLRQGEDVKINLNPHEVLPDEAQLLVIGHNEDIIKMNGNDKSQRLN